MNIYHPNADMNAINTSYSQYPSLERFVNEFCAAFPNVKVYRADKYEVFLTNEHGLGYGKLYVAEQDDKDSNGNWVPRYYFQSIAVKKERSNSHGREVRDSSKIKSLITSIKKNGEEPTDTKILNGYMSGIRYAFGNILKRRGVRFDLSSEQSIAMASYFLNGEQPSREVADSVRALYDTFLNESAKGEDEKKTYSRFCEGSTLIGYMRDESKPYYIVCTVSRDLAENIMIHGDVKRYESLKDHPELSPTVAMIHAWASGQPSYDPKNDLGLDVRDHFYEEIDVSAGYNRHNQGWFLIPNRGE